MEHHSYHSKAETMYERTMELVVIQVESVMDELEQLALLIDEIQDDDIRDRLDNQVNKAMRYLDRI